LEDAINETNDAHEKNPTLGPKNIMGKSMANQPPRIIEIKDQTFDQKVRRSLNHATEPLVMDIG